MSILIKGMKMPQKGTSVAIVIEENGDVSIPDAYWDCELSKGAKAVEPPDHENLISREALAKDLGIAANFDCEKCGWRKEKPYPYCSAELDDTCFALENAEIIIPAERSEE